MPFDLECLQPTMECATIATEWGGGSTALYSDRMYSMQADTNTEGREWGR